MSTHPTRQGVSLRLRHAEGLLDDTSRVDWVELVSDPFLGVRGGPKLYTLDRLREHLPISLHSIGLSIGSLDPLDSGYVAALRALVDRVQPVVVSDHLAWRSHDGRELDFLPILYTEEALIHAARRTCEVQDALGLQVLFENPSAYLAFADSTMKEWEFLSALCREAGCGILLDVNSLYVSARNNAFAAEEYLAGLPAEHVREIHVSGHRDLGDFILDTHECPVPECVWRLYRSALQRFGSVPTIIEWETGNPSLDDLIAECDRSAALAREAIA